jgi:hypothetical protein
LYVETPQTDIARFQPNSDLAAFVNVKAKDLDLTHILLPRLLQILQIESDQLANEVWQLDYLKLDLSKGCHSDTLSLRYLQRKELYLLHILCQCEAAHHLVVFLDTVHF